MKNLIIVSSQNFYTQYARGFSSKSLKKFTMKTLDKWRESL